MKTFNLARSLALAAGLLAPVAWAQSSATAVTSPSSPAPAVTITESTSPSAVPVARPAVDRIIYVPRLPTAAELAAVAKAQNLAIVQIEQTANEVVIVYQLADGRRSVIAYQLLPSDGSSSTPAVVTGATTPTVVYYTPTSEPRRVYYYGAPSVYYDPFYYPWIGPVSLSLGFGWDYHSGHGGGWRGGGFHGRH